MANKKMQVPDLDGLLGTIAKAHEAQPRAPIQSIVAPVAGKEAKSQNVKTAKKENSEKKTGRPSVKDMENVVYVKISPRIPAFIKKAAGQALLDERFRSTEGHAIKTLDELVTHALECLLFAKK